MMVVLFLFTFGIYPIIWMYKFQNEIKATTGEGFSGIIHVVLSFVTFGIYPIYWFCVTGKRLAKAGAEDKNTLYVILTLLMFIAIPTVAVVPFMMQDQANKLAA